jgi:hypothetical protein
MAQITFLATDDDCAALWELILIELRLVAYPDPWFGELPAPELRTLEDISANLAIYPRIAPGLGYFLTSLEWTMESLEYRLCANNPNFPPHWNVNPRYGGPAIHFIPSVSDPWHKQPHHIVSGMFSDYPSYYSAVDHGQVIERPAGLAATMKTIRQRLRSLGKTVQAPSGHRALALRKALLAHAAGIVLRTGDIIYSPIASQRRTRRHT